MEIVVFFCRTVHPFGGRSGVAEILHDADAGIQLVEKLLAGASDQLAVCPLRSPLWCGIIAVDVYCENVPFQHGLSNDQPKLRFWNVCRHVFFP